MLGMEWVSVVVGVLCAIAYTYFVPLRYLQKMSKRGRLSRLDENALITNRRLHVPTALFVLLLFVGAVVLTTIFGKGWWGIAYLIGGFLAGGCARFITGNPLIKGKGGER